MIPAREEFVKAEQKTGDITFLFDLNLLRPACIFFQVIAKTDWTRLTDFFSPITWLSSETREMMRVTETVEEWRKVVELAMKQGVISR